MSQGGSTSSNAEPRSMIGMCTDGKDITLIWPVSEAFSERRRLRGNAVSKKGRHDCLSSSNGSGVGTGLKVSLVTSLVLFNIGRGRNSISLNVWDL